MIVRLIAETVTPIVTKSRFLRVLGARGMVSNQPYLDLHAPSYHGCRTTLIVKQGTNRLPIYRRAYMGYLHVDFKVKTRLQAVRQIQQFLLHQCVGQFTGWGYGAINWILEKQYATPDSSHSWRPRFRILKGLPPDLTLQERQLVMAALLHDLVDTDLHVSKLGSVLPISDLTVRWLCTHHHALHAHPNHPGLQLLQAADIRASRYARLLVLPTYRRKLAPVNTVQLARQLEEAADCSIYKLYSTIYHSQGLNHLTASKLHPTETLRNHLTSVANWVLFLLRTTGATSVALAGELDEIPSPVEVEDPRVPNEP